MNVTVRRFRTFLVVWALLVLALFVTVNVGDAATDRFDGFWELWHRNYFGPLYSTILVLPLIAFVRPIARAYGGWRTALGAANWSLALGATAFGIGNGVYFYYNTCSRWPGALGCSRDIEVPYPSLADVGFLLLLPFVLYGLVRLSSVLGFRRRDLATVGALFVVLAVPTAYLTWSTSFGSHEFGRGWLYDPEQRGFLDAVWTIARGDGAFDDLTNVVSGIYMFFDVVLLSMAVTLILLARRVSGGRFFLPVLAAAAALVAQYAGDMAYFKRVFDGTQHTGDYADLLYWLAMFLFMATVALFGRVIVQLTAAPAASAAQQ